MALPPLFRNAALTLAIAFRRLWESFVSGQEKRSRCHGNGAASDEHFRNGIVRQFGLSCDTARPAHFNSLLDDCRRLGWREAVTHQPRNAAAGCGAGRGICAAVELHARMPVRARCVVARGGGSDAVEEFCVAAVEVTLRIALRYLETLRDFERAQRHNAEGHPGGNGLRRVMGVEVVDTEAEGRGDGAAIVRKAEGWIVLLHGAMHAVLIGWRWREADGDGANVECECDRVCAA